MLKLFLIIYFSLPIVSTALAGAGQDDPEELKREVARLRQQLIRSQLEIFNLRLEKARNNKDPKQAFPIILKDGLGSEFPELNRQAFLELGKLPVEEQKKALDAVLEKWKTSDPVFRVDALPFLNSVDHPDATALIFTAARDVSANVRRAAAGVLKTTNGNRARILLEELLSDPESEVRSMAIEALGVPKNEAAVKPLLRLLQKEKDPALLEKASHALGVIGNKNAVPGLLEILSSPNENVQWAAINSLGKIGEREAIEYIRPFLAQTHSLPLRKIAITTLGRLKDQASLPTILKMLIDDPDEELQKVAADAIGRLDDPSALDETLECFTRNKSDSVRKAIWETILKLAAEDFDRLKKVLLSVLSQEKISPIEEIARKIYALDLNGSKRLPPLVEKISHWMFSAKEWRRALLHYKKLVSILPGHIEGHKQMAQCYLELGDNESAVRSLEAAAGLSRATPALWWKLQERIMELLVKIDDPVRIVEKAHDLMAGSNGPVPVEFSIVLEQNYRNGSTSLLRQLQTPDENKKRTAIAKLIRLGRRIVLPLAEALPETPSPALIEAGNAITGTKIPSETTEETLLEDTARAWRLWYKKSP